MSDEVLDDVMIKGSCKGKADAIVNCQCNIESAPVRCEQAERCMFYSYYTNICSVCQDEKTGTCGPAQPKVLKKASGNHGPQPLTAAQPFSPSPWHWPACEDASLFSYGTAKAAALSRGP